MVNPVAGVAIAVFCAVVIRGGRNPRVVESACRIAEAFKATPPSAKLVPVAAPNTGVTRVGVVAKTNDPDPVVPAYDVLYIVDHTDPL